MSVIFAAIAKDGAIVASDSKWQDPAISGHNALKLWRLKNGSILTACGGHGATRRLAINLNRFGSVDEIPIVEWGNLSEAESIKAFLINQDRQLFSIDGPNEIIQIEDRLWHCEGSGGAYAAGAFQCELSRRKVERMTLYELKPIILRSLKIACTLSQSCGGSIRTLTI